MRTQPDLAAFERVRGQIGSCGIWCGSCAVGNGCLAELSVGLGNLLTAYDAPEWASITIGWKEFLDTLGSLGQTVSCVGCRHGGGRDNCEIRACAVQRGHGYCVECPSFGLCDHTAIVDHMRSKAAAIGMSVLSPGEDPEEAISEWTRTVRAQWPCCVLFAEGG